MRIATKIRFVLAAIVACFAVGMLLLMSQGKGGSTNAEQQLSSAGTVTFPAASSNDLSAATTISVGSLPTGYVPQSTDPSPATVAAGAVPSDPYGARVKLYLPQDFTPQQQQGSSPAPNSLLVTAIARGTVSAAQFATYEAMISDSPSHFTTSGSVGAVAVENDPNQPGVHGPEVGEGVIITSNYVVTVWAEGITPAQTQAALQSVEVS